MFRRLAVLIDGPDRSLIPPAEFGRTSVGRYLNLRACEVVYCTGCVKWCTGGEIDVLLHNAL